MRSETGCRQAAGPLSTLGLAGCHHNSAPPSAPSSLRLHVRLGPSEAAFTQGRGRHVTGPLRRAGRVGLSWDGSWAARLGVESLGLGTPGLSWKLGHALGRPATGEGVLSVHRCL